MTAVTRSCAACLYSQPSFVRPDSLLQVRLAENFMTTTRTCSHQSLSGGLVLAALQGDVQDVT